MRQKSIGKRGGPVRNAGAARLCGEALISDMIFVAFHSRKSKAAWEGLDYRHARYSDSEVGAFLSVDPKADVMPSWSPYTFVFNNPLSFIDPDGRMAVDAMGPPDDYKVDEQGNISLLRKTDDNFDVLYNNDESKSIQVDKGVLNNSRTNTVTGSNGKEYTFDQYDVTGDDKAKGLFEFAGDNTEVEWSIIGVGANSGDKGKNILTTSHIKDAEIGGGYLKAYGYTIRKHSHSHPYHNYPSPKDMKFAKSLNLKFPKATLDIYHKGEYFKYNESGLISIPTITLPEIEIKAPKND